MPCDNDSIPLAADIQTSTFTHCQLTIGIIFFILMGIIMVAWYNQATSVRAMFDLDAIAAATGSPHYPLRLFLVEWWLYR